MYENINISNKYCCRICLEDDDLENLIYPCMCNGSSKYVHKYCLNQWRTISSNSEALNKCFECNYTYITVNSNYNPSFLSKFFKFLSNNIIIFFIFNFVIISILYEIINIIDKNNKLVNLLVNNNQKNKNIYLYYNIIWATIFYIIILLLLAIFNFILFIKKKKIYLKYYISTKSYIISLCIIIILLSLFFFIDNLLGLFVLTFFVQLILKNHFKTIEIIKEINSFEIQNYIE